MNTHRTQHFVRTIIVLATLAGLPTIPTSRADDPNTPKDTWDQFVATWESATLAVTEYNPVERPDVDPLTREHLVTVSGSIYTLDTNDLIALSTTHVTVLQAWDQDGNEVLFDPNAPEQSLARTWILGESPKAYSVELHLDPNQTVPTSLLELDFTVDALYGQPFTTVDLPMEVTEDWIELAPRYRIRVDEANMVDDVCHIVVKAEATDVSGSATYSFDPNNTWEEHVSPRGTLYRLSDLDVISQVEIIDTGETPSWRGGSSSHSSRGADGGRDLTWRFTLRNCTGTENLLIRHTLAMDPYEVPIPLIITDVTVPGL